MAKIATNPRVSHVGYVSENLQVRPGARPSAVGVSDVEVDGEPLFGQLTIQARFFFFDGPQSVLVNPVHDVIVVVRIVVEQEQFGQPGFRFNRKVRRSQLLGEVLTDGGLVLLESKKVNGSAGGECRAKEGHPGNVVPVVMGE